MAGSALTIKEPRAPRTAARVFATPELLRMILDFHFCSDLSDYGPFRTRKRSACFMRVNSLWHFVVAEIKWKTCGWVEGPYILDLVQMAWWPDRLEWYSSFIEELNLSNEPIDDDGLDFCLPQIPSVLEGSSRQERKKYDQLLPDLKFPRLHTLHLDEPRSDGTEQAAISYIRPSLKDVSLNIGELSPGLLRSLQSCLQLKELYIRFPRSELVADVSVDAIAAFKALLNTQQSLNHLYWGGHYDTVTYEIFFALAEHTPLKWLKIPAIRKDWVKKILNGAQKPFENLTTIITRIRGPDFELLAPYFRKIQSLRIVARESFPFETLRHLPDLRALSVKFDYDSPSSLHWEGLVLAARYCPNLTSIHLGDDRGMSDGVTNDIIDKVTTLLPGLESINLDGIHIAHAALTLESILYFGRRCKALKKLELADTQLSIDGLVD